MSSAARIEGPGRGSLDQLFSDGRHHRPWSWYDRAGKSQCKWEHRPDLALMLAQDLNTPLEEACRTPHPGGSTPHQVPPLRTALHLVNDVRSESPSARSRSICRRCDAGP